MVRFLFDLQCGYTKFSCFLCFWESRARAKHWVKQDWPVREESMPGEKNVQAHPLVERSKIISPPLYIKFAIKSDDEVAGDFVHLPRRILAATAEIGSSTAENVPASSSSGEPIRKKMKKSRKQWVKNFPKSEIPEKPPRVFGPNIHGYLHSCCRTPAEAFSLLFSEAFLDEIIEQSHIYAKQRGSDVSITKSEFYCFLGVLLVSGYHPVPYRRLYWSKDDDVHNLLVFENIRRNTFDKILQFLHFADNTKINQDRYYKIRPLFSHLNRCFKILPLNDNLSIDETIVVVVV